MSAFENFGLPTVLRTRSAAVVFPILEIALGVSLVTATGMLWVFMAWVSVGVTAAFLVLMARASSRGERFDCGCFGAAHTPISVSLVIRNVLLLLAAIGTTVVASARFDSVPAILADLDADDWAWFAAAVFLGGMSAAFVYSVRRPSPPASDQRREGLTGSMLPDLYLQTAGQEPVRLHDMLQEKPRLLLVVRPGCSSCNLLLSDPRALHDVLDPTVELVLAVVGADETFQTAHPDLVDVALFGAWPVADYLRVSVYPAAVLVGAGGLVLAEPVAGREAIGELCTQSSSLLGPHPRSLNR